MKFYDLPAEALEKMRAISAIHISGEYKDSPFKTREWLPWGEQPQDACQWYLAWKKRSFGGWLLHPICCLFHRHNWFLEWKEFENIGEGSKPHSGFCTKCKRTWDAR